MVCVYSIAHDLCRVLLILARNFMRIKRFETWDAHIRCTPTFGHEIRGKSCSIYAHDYGTWFVKHLQSPVALLDRCCRVPFWRKVGEISRRWQFCDIKNATRYLVVGSLGVLMTQRDISGLAVKGLNAYPHTVQHNTQPFSLVWFNPL